MIYFFHGTDAVKAKRKIRTLTDALLAKKPDALYVYFDERSFDTEVIKSLFHSTGLFAERHIIFLDRTYAALDSVDMIKDMKESEHIFILFEDTLQKKDVAHIEKHSEKAEQYDISVSPKKDGRKGIFPLTDALGARDRKRAWMLYQECLGEGMSVDEMYPMLFWQVKSMLAASMAKNPKDADMKNFTYTKSKRYAEKYGGEALRELSRKMLTALYDSRRGASLDHEVEKTLLSL